MIESGDFENAYSRSSNNYILDQATQTRTFDIKPWKIESGNIKIISNSYGRPRSGITFIDLSGSTPGSISQTFTVIAGLLYTLSFYSAVNPNSQTQSVRVITPSKTQDFEISGTSNWWLLDWKLFTIDFYSTTASATIIFQSLTGNGPLLDEVLVNPTGLIYLSLIIIPPG